MTTREGKRSLLEERFELILLACGRDLPSPVREYQFYPARKWRFDYCWPDQHIAVEIDGGSHTLFGGKHATDRDREKLGFAAALGYRVIPFSGEMLQSSQWCMDLLRSALKQGPLPEKCPAVIQEAQKAKKQRKRKTADSLEAYQLCSTQRIPSRSKPTITRANPRIQPSNSKGVGRRIA